MATTRYVALKQYLVGKTLLRNRCFDVNIIVEQRTVYVQTHQLTCGLQTTFSQSPTLDSNPSPVHQPLLFPGACVFVCVRGGANVIFCFTGTLMNALKTDIQQCLFDDASVDHHYLCLNCIE